MKNENNWEPGSWWFWPVFIGLILVTILGAVVPIVMLVLVPVYIGVGITVVRQNHTPGPHRMLGFTLMLLGGIVVIAGVIIVLFMMPSFSRVYSSISSPYTFGYPPPGGYTFIEPRSQPPRIVPENTQEVITDPILLGVTETIAAATAQRLEMLTATPPLTAVPFVIIITPTPQ
jgi:hypothetical protein